ncbi:hypothetical protein [Nocardiopsis sp. RV163]|uniref:hypothetical protein n=1 Tax=Nocardiopsis sp. RV163 TaxID=1661388 RepID=UPI00064C2C09|nr:hypothetical protein [Nocardiopsis sp. RV163]
MELTLSGGGDVILTSAMRRSIRLAAPLDDRLDAWCPDVREPGESAPLIAQGLAERDADGVLVLTGRGVRVRALLLSLVGLVGEPGHEGRPTLDPSLPEERARRLRLALEAVRGGRPRRGTGGNERNKAFARVVYAFLWAVFTCWMVLDLPLSAELALVTASSLAVAGAVLVRERHQRAERERDPVRIVTASEGEFVSPGALDEESRALLGRAQRAVDAVLGSPLHECGLLLDTVRNRVVLADVEWSLARSLLHQTRVRERIARTPTPGERSREAAARAGAVLAAETAEVTARIAVLEDYADRVRAAELDDRDRRSARELDAIAAEAAEAGAVHEQSAETLDSLVRAQELALRVAALADDRG